MEKFIMDLKFYVLICTDEYAESIENYGRHDNLSNIFYGRLSAYYNMLENAMGGFNL